MFAIAFIIFIISVFIFDEVRKRHLWFFGINILTFICIYFGIVGIPLQIGEGKHTGIITAIDTKGIFFKSTTVYFKTDANSSQEDKYCLKDKSILADLNKARDEKTIVTLEYIDNLDNGIACGTGEIIIGIK